MGRKPCLYGELMVADGPVAPVSSPIVLYGATGHTGRLIAERLSLAGAAPLLVGRDAGRVSALARELGGAPHAVADSRRPETLSELVPPGSVLVSTVGPFARWGEAALSAAIASGATYLDSTGEPSFIAGVFGRDAAARRTGATLLTAMGYDYVPGALAGALALRRGGDSAVRVEIGYFAPGRRASAGLSRGTRRSAAGVLLHPSFAFRDAELRMVRSGERARRFHVDGSPRPALSVGGAEHFGLPAVFGNLEEVNVYVGWFGGATPWLRAGCAALSRPASSAAVRERLVRIADRLADRPTDAIPEGAGETLVVASAHDRGGSTLARVVLCGPEPYTFTADFIAWAALRAARSGVRAGALGPLGAFGLAGLGEGCAAAGLHVIDGAPHRGISRF